VAKFFVLLLPCQASAFVAGSDASLVVLDYVGISPFGLHLPNFTLHFVALQSLSFG
jgi:hypothetical protein